MLLHLSSGILRPAGALVELAELIMGGRMLRFEPENRFKFGDGVIEVTQTGLGQAELEMQGGHGVVDLLALLERLDGLHGLI